MRMNKNWIVGAAAVLASATALLALPAQAASVVVEIAPPAPQVEVVPVARPGYMWVGGHYEWRHHNYFWVPGSYVVLRPGYHYVQPQWVQVGHRWNYVPGNWAREVPPPHGHYDHYDHHDHDHGHYDHHDRYDH